MNKKNQKGFTLILSLVLLLVMSLMGGSLIVISSGDHQSNNTSDEYQQTFYVAEHALVEAEKYLINEMIGPWVDPQSTIRIVPPGAGASTEELEAHANYLNSLQQQATLNGGFARHTDASVPWPLGRGTPVNINTGANTPCLNSFRNLIRNDAGDVIKYEVTLTNTGQTNLADFEITDILQTSTGTKSIEVDPYIGKSQNYFWYSWSIDDNEWNWSESGSIGGYQVSDNNYGSIPYKLVNHNGSYAVQYTFPTYNTLPSQGVTTNSASEPAFSANLERSTASSVEFEPVPAITLSLFSAYSTASSTTNLCSS